MFWFRKEKQISQAHAEAKLRKEAERCELRVWITGEQAPRIIVCRGYPKYVKDHTH